MCKKLKGLYNVIDTCMRVEIEELNKAGIITLACCCGHGKYPKTIVAKSHLNGMPYEIFTKQYIPRKRKFYKKDKDGIYFIPEVVEK